METDNFITKTFPSDRPKTWVGENKIQDNLIRNKTVIPLTLVWYELMAPIRYLKAHIQHAFVE